MLEAGTLLGERYEIIKKVGAGGMSVVYKAECKKLKRFVAIKVLREEFVGDETFVSKFRVEAQAAASLSHPNIINVFDVGSDNEIHYIVMEFVEGVTLQEYVKENGPLSSTETLEIAIKIAKALKVAHMNKIVHRDIKPQNIIISSTGDVKVTDFGIARAASSSTITSNANAIGSVHYFSPEQARGGFVDEKSDLYSLGITMYEMITNAVPFQADSPVTVAIQQIKNDLPSPKLINPNVTESLEAIIIKSTLKKPERRYQTATELISDMERALEEPHNSFVQVEKDYEVSSPTINISGKDLEKIKEEAKEHDHLFNDEPTAYKEVSNSSSSKNGDKWVVISAVVTSLVIIAGLVFLGLKFIGKGNDSSESSTSIVSSNVVMVDLLGKGFDEAKELLASKGLNIKKVDEKYSTTYAVGAIIEQSVDQGTSVKKEDVIEVVLSLGEETLKAPSLMNLSLEEAKKILFEQQLKVDVISANDDTVPMGLVMDQNPKADEKIEPGATIHIMISSGPKEKKVIMPDLKGMTQGEASSTLSGVGLKIGKVTEYYTDDGEVGRIFKQTIAEGSQVSKGYTIDVGISKGPKPKDDTGSEGDSEPTTTEPAIETPDSSSETPDTTETPTTEEPTTQSDGTVKYTITSDMMGSLDEAYVVVGLKTADNIDYIHQSQMKKSELPFTINVKGKGKGVIQVHVNGKLKSEDEVNFD